MPILRKREGWVLSTPSRTGSLPTGIYSWQRKGSQSKMTEKKASYLWEVNCRHVAIEVQNREISPAEEALGWLSEEGMSELYVKRGQGGGRMGEREQGSEGRQLLGRVCHGAQSHTAQEEKRVSSICYVSDPGLGLGCRDKAPVLKRLVL